MDVDSINLKHLNELPGNLVTFPSDDWAEPFYDRQNPNAIIPESTVLQLLNSCLATKEINLKVFY